MQAEGVSVLPEIPTLQVRGGASRAKPGEERPQQRLAKYHLGYVVIQLLADVSRSRNA